MKKALSIILATMITCSAFSSFAVSAAEADNSSVSAGISFNTYDALYVHAVAGASDTEAWQAWQCEHDEDFNKVNSNVMYFFLPSSASDTEVEIYNAYDSTVEVGNTQISADESAIVTYSVDTPVTVTADGKTYTLNFMKSNAEAAIYINNSDADGNGTDLMTYLNVDKSRSAKATGAIVEPDGSIDNTSVKKIKGRGNTTWGKPKKAYNITYDSNVKIAGMDKGKKYTILANYQDDSLSRNRFLYDLSDAVGMPYASDSRYVDFYANGYYWGSYLMTEKVEVGKNTLIEDFEEEDYLNEDGTVKEDFPFLCEVDAGATDGEDYYVETSSGNKVTIKCPELEEGDTGYEEVKEYVKTKFDNFFNTVKSKSKDPSTVADLDSLTKIYLINELGKNWDSGVSSLFFTYKQDTDGTYKFFASPVWDYDNSLGNAVGVERVLSNIGVSDYEEYSGWWCQYMGRKSGSRTTSNIMNYISRNNYVVAAAPQIWFEDFVPAINHFAGTNTNSIINEEIYTADKYYELVSDSAEMNYQSGWLLDTGSWIADHTSLNVASFDLSTKTYTVDSKVTTYANTFEGMYNYCVDWMTSRAAWLSSEMADDYTPTEYKKGDIDLNGEINVTDSTIMQKYACGLMEITSLQLEIGDVNGDGRVNVMDSTEVQKYIAGLITSFN